MKLLYAIVPVACLPGGLVTAKSTKLQTQSYSNGPSSIDEWVNLGKKQLGQGKAKESAASYRKALKASCTAAQSSTAAYAGLCQASLALEDWRSAQKACGKSLSFRNAVEDCLSVREQAQVSLDGFRIASHFGHNHEAEARLREVIALLPENPVGYFNLGIVLLDLQRSEEALPLVETAAQLSLDGASGDWSAPSSEAAATVSNQVELIGLLHLDAKRYQEASKWLKLALNAPGLRDNFVLAHHLRVAERLAWLESATALRIDQCLAIERSGRHNNGSNTAAVVNTKTATGATNNPHEDTRLGIENDAPVREETAAATAAAVIEWPSDEKLQKMSAKKLRKLIQSAGGDHDDCFGKSELLTRVQELQETTPVAITQPPSVKEERTEQGRSTTRNEQGTATSTKSAALSVEMNPAAAAAVSADGKVQAAATNEREANQRISAAKGPKFSTEVLTVLRARKRWEKEAAQMLNQYKGFRPPHAGWVPTEIEGRPPTPTEFQSYVQRREPLVVRGGRRPSSKGKGKGGRRNDNRAVLEALNWRLQDWTSDQLKEVLSTSNSNSNKHAKGSSSSSSTSSKVSKASSTGNSWEGGQGGRDDGSGGGGGQVHVFAAQQPFGEVGLFGGPGQPPAKSQSRPQDSYRVSLEWTAFVDALFHEPSSAAVDSSSHHHSHESTSNTTVAHSLAQPDVSMYFAIQPGADQNDKNPYEFPLGASPRLLADIPLPTDLIPAASLTSANMWFGKAARGNSNDKDEDKNTKNKRRTPSCAEIHTHLHNDPQDNLYVLVSGQKKFTLWAPDSVLNLQPVTPPSRVRSDGFVEWSNSEKRFKGYRFSEVPGLQGYCGPKNWARNQSAGPLSASFSFDEMCATAAHPKRRGSASKSGSAFDGKVRDGIEANGGGGGGDYTSLVEAESAEKSAEWRGAISAIVAAEGLRAEFPQWSHTSIAVEVTLEAGDLLYLPRGWYHEVTTTCGLKVSDVVDDDANSGIQFEEGASSPPANMHDRVTLAVNHWFDPAALLAKR